MGAQPVCPKPAPEVVAALCARFGDEARLAVLKMLAAKAESNVDIESPKPAQSASAVPSSPVVEGKDAAPKSPAAAVTTPTSMSPLPPGPSAPPQPTGPVADPAFTDSEIKTLSEPVPFAAWGPLHERALAYMRWRRDSAVASDASLAPSPEAAADMRLWRFVVAKNFDCPGAAEMYIGMLRWRRDAGMDKFRGEVLEANSGFFIDGAALLQTVLPCERDRKVMAAQPRMFTLEVEGGHQLLRDRSGNVVYIECPGTLDYPAILAIGDADYVRAVALARHASASPRPHTPWPLAPQLLRCPQPHTAAPNPTTAPLSPHHPQYVSHHRIYSIAHPSPVLMASAPQAAAACFSQELQMLVLDELSRRTGRLVLMLRVMDMSGINMVRRHVHSPICALQPLPLFVEVPPPRARRLRFSCARPACAPFAVRRPAFVRCACRRLDVR